MALAARIASPQGVAFHTSTDAAPRRTGRQTPIIFFKLFLFPNLDSSRRRRRVVANDASLRSDGRSPRAVDSGCVAARLRTGESARARPRRRWVQRRCFNRWPRFARCVSCAHREACLQCRRRAAMPLQLAVGDVSNDAAARAGVAPSHGIVPRHARPSPSR